MTKYTLAPRAQRDADEIGEYTQREWGKAQREKYVKALRTTIEQVADMPGIGRDVSHMRKGLRAYPCGTHVIFYRQESVGITVIRILHQSQSTIRAFFRGAPST